MRKRFEEDAAAPAPSWLTVTGSIYIILLSFFICLCSYGAMERSEQKFERASTSVRRSFFSAVPRPPARAAARKQAPAVGNNVAYMSNEDAHMAESIAQFIRHFDNRGMRLKESAYGMDLVIPAPRLFENGSSSLRAQSAALLDDIGAFCRSGSYPIGIEGRAARDEGHADWYLSLMRAVAVAEYLKRSGMIDADRMYSSGQQAAEQAADGNDALVIRLYMRE